MSWHEIIKVVWLVLRQLGEDTGLKPGEWFLAEDSHL
jgi:hypothetical protein